MITQKPTPNFSSRSGYKPEIIVLHISTGSLSSCCSWFAKKESKVSAHYIVCLKGFVYQFVKDEDCAWANGPVKKPTAKKVIAKGQISANRYTLSIEHEGKDLAKAPILQLNASAGLIKALATKWKIPLDRDHIIGHYEIYCPRASCPSPDKTVIDRLLSIAKMLP